MKLALLVIVLGLTLVALYYTNAMFRHYKDEDRAALTRATSRCLVVVGIWQISIGIYLGYMGTWTDSIMLVGAGLFVIVAGRMQLWNV